MYATYEQIDMDPLCLKSIFGLIVGSLSIALPQIVRMGHVAMQEKVQFHLRNMMNSNEAYQPL